MRKLNVQKDLTNELFLDIDRHLNSIVKRNISYILNVVSPELATISLFVNGKKGTSQINIILQYASKKVAWEAHTPSESYELTGINEISTVCKQLISRMYTVIGKF
jgi:hypothetical protein